MRNWKCFDADRGRIQLGIFGSTSSPISRIGKTTTRLSTPSRDYSVICRLVIASPAHKGTPMPTLTKGSFSLNLGIVKLGGDLSDDDRQCAWELYTELSTRVAVTGKADDPDCVQFGGELYIESLDSLYNFFWEARGIMRKFPVGR